MNGVSHYAFSVIITIAIASLFKFKERESKIEKYLVYTVIFLINFGFHAIVDSLADITYHPSDASWGNPFFTTWHIIIYSMEAIFGIIVLRRDLRYTIGLIASVGYDIWDWSIGRFLLKYYNITLPRIHNNADWINSTFFFWLPNLRNENWAIISEILIVAVLWIFWTVKRSNFEEQAKPGSWLQVTGLVLFFGFWRVMTFF